jgi:glycosyltransferase involved in cell wall biosynthesis
MKVALVHDWLNHKVGGAERVLFELAALYPKAPVYTLAYNPRLFKKLVKPERVVVSSLQKTPSLLRQRPRYLLPLIPRAIAGWDFSQFDVVITSSAGYSQNITTGSNTCHVNYCHTPLRAVWDYWPQYLDEQNVGILRQAYIRRQVSKLRIWDFLGSRGVDCWLANYYRRQAKVIYPPVNSKSFKPRAKKDFYLVAAMLTPYKKVELAIEACQQLGRQLVVIGDGPHRRYLESLNQGGVEFKGYVDETTKKRLLAEAKALIFPGEEDFGIAPIEAMASGTPVIAYGKGGVTETVKEGETGVFFHQPEPHALAANIERFEAMEFKTASLLKRARDFDQVRFRRQIKQAVKAAHARHVHSK